MHLFVIVTPPCPNSSMLLLSLSTIRDGKYHDPTCVFDGGEHEFIVGPSYVVYSRAEQRFVQGIQTCVEGKVFIPKAPLDDLHVSRMCQGIQASGRTKPWALEYYIRHGAN